MAEPCAVQVEALEELTRALVGIAWSGAHAAPPGVTFPQMRLLLVLHSLGRVPSSRLAAALGVNASSVTRLADKLEARGYLARGADPNNRSLVTVVVTESGDRVVDQILQRRRAAFLAVLNRLPDTDRESTVAAARVLAAALSAASETTASAKSVEWEGSSS